MINSITISLFIWWCVDLVSDFVVRVKWKGQGNNLRQRTSPSIPLRHILFRWKMAENIEEIYKFSVKDVVTYEERSGSLVACADPESFSEGVKLFFFFFS